jgi:hypothetical protein
MRKCSSSGGSRLMLLHHEAFLKVCRVPLHMFEKSNQCCSLLETIVALAMSFYSSHVLPLQVMRFVNMRVKLFHKQSYEWLQSHNSWLTSSAAPNVSTQNTLTPCYGYLYRDGCIKVFGVVGVEVRFQSPSNAPCNFLKVIWWQGSRTASEFYTSHYDW